MAWATSTSTWRHSNTRQRCSAGEHEMHGMRARRRTSVMVCMVAALAFALALASSCGSNNPTGPTLPTTTSIRGSVHQGPVTGAHVDIRHVRPDGTIGEVISGSYTTDVNGDWAGTIPAAL